MGRFLTKLQKKKHLSQIRVLTPSPALSYLLDSTWVWTETSRVDIVGEVSYMQACVSYMWILEKPTCLPVLPWSR